MGKWHRYVQCQAGTPCFLVLCRFSKSQSFLFHHMSWAVGGSKPTCVHSVPSFPLPDTNTSSPYHCPRKLGTFSFIMETLNKLKQTDRDAWIAQGWHQCSPNLCSLTTALVLPHKFASIDNHIINSIWLRRNTTYPNMKSPQYWENGIDSSMPSRHPMLLGIVSLF